MNEEVELLQKRMGDEGYISERPITVALYLSQSLKKPLLIEGEAGVGKTELAKVFARLHATELIRLQCYEGLDSQTALYEWNYQRQLLRIRMEEQAGLDPERMEQRIFSRDCLLERPLLQAITRKERPPVLLIDEIDRADEGFEAFLLELLSDFQITIPELGTVRAEQVPFVILTSNRTRDLSDALRRRCLYLWIDHPSLEKEVAILKRRLPDISGRLARQIGRFVHQLRERRLYKTPGVAESLDWARALMALHRDHLDPDIVMETLGCLLKDHHDLRRLESGALQALVAQVEEESPT